MIFTDEIIWESCTKEEYDREAHKLFSGYRRIPIYHSKPYGIIEQIKLYGVEPDEWKYEKAVGKKRICMLSTREAEDKELMAALKEMYRIEEDVQ